MDRISMTSEELKQAVEAHALRSKQPAILGLVRQSSKKDHIEFAPEGSDDWIAIPLALIEKAEQLAERPHGICTRLLMSIRLKQPTTDEAQVLWSLLAQLGPRSGNRVLLRVFRCDNKLTIRSITFNRVLYDEYHDYNPQLNQQVDFTQYTALGINQFYAEGWNGPFQGPPPALNPYEFQFDIVLVDWTGKVVYTYVQEHTSSNNQTAPVGKFLDRHYNVTMP